MCDRARANDVTESINYKYHFLKRKLIIEGISRYFCHKSTFEDKLNACRQTGAGMQFHFINNVRRPKVVRVLMSSVFIAFCLLQFSSY